jgi:hypothetical protein
MKCYYSIIPSFPVGISRMVGGEFPIIKHFGNSDISNYKQKGRRKITGFRKRVRVLMVIPKRGITV